MIESVNIFTKGIEEDELEFVKSEMLAFSVMDSEGTEMNVLIEVVNVPDALVYDPQLAEHARASIDGLEKLTTGRITYCEPMLVRPNDKKHQAEVARAFHGASYPVEMFTANEPVRIRPIKAGPTYETPF